MDDLNPEVKIPIIQEELIVGKKVVEKAKYVLDKVVTEENVEIDLTLRKQEISIKRIPKDIEVEVAPQIRYEGNITIIPVVEEIAIVVKKLILKEEIHIEHQENTEQFTQTETLRKERMDIKVKKNDNQ